MEEIFSNSRASHHAITMTGELVDLFSSRSEGVMAIANVARKILQQKQITFFSGEKGFVSFSQCQNNIEHIASMNWYATGLLAARQLQLGLLMDIGSTTSDLMLVREGKLHAQGNNDFMRLASDELVYTGLVRTPLMALAQKILFDEKEVGVMAEYFATTADVYRVLGELPENADQHAAADNGEKTIAASARRIARMIGRDVESASENDWRELAQQFAHKQLQQLEQACLKQLARNLIDANAPLIGAGCGSFIVRKLAKKLNGSFAADDVEAINNINTCAPAYSVAALAYNEISALIKHRA
jgi:probable H4MPT-linked C1 transfer pathway protein